MNAPSRTTQPATSGGMGWKGYLGVGLVLFLFVLGFLLPRRGSPLLTDGPPAPRLELSSIALTQDFGGGAQAAIEHGARVRLELASDGAGGLAVFELPGFGRAGEPPRLHHLGALEAGPVSIPLIAPEVGESLCLVLVLCGEPPDEDRAQALLALVRQSGPWTAPVLLRELRAEPRLGGSTDPIARAYGISVALRPPE